MKKIIKLMVILCVVLFFGEAAAHAWPIGEDLVQPSPIPGKGWHFEKLVNKQHTMEMARWAKGTGGAAQIFQVVTIKGKPQRSVDATKVILNKNGKTHCRTYSNHVDDKGLRNGYDTITWKTSCRLRGANTRVVILHKLIAGDDALYALQKIWRNSYSQVGFRAWNRYFKRISLCDTRGSKHPCPKDETSTH